MEIVKIDFEIERVVVTGPRTLVIAKHLGSEDFSLETSLKLGGVPVINPTMPRSLDKLGNPRYDLWIFTVSQTAKSFPLRSGQIVQLEIDRSNV